MLIVLSFLQVKSLSSRPPSLKVKPGHTAISSRLVIGDGSDRFRLFALCGCWESGEETVMDSYLRFFPKQFLNYPACFTLLKGNSNLLPDLARHGKSRRGRGSRRRKRLRRRPWHARRIPAGHGGCFSGQTAEGSLRMNFSRCRIGILAHKKPML